MFSESSGDFDEIGTITSSFKVKNIKKVYT